MTMSHTDLSVSGMTCGGCEKTVERVLSDASAAVREAGRGPVQLCLIGPELPGEVEVDLGQDFAVNPQIKGALKSLAGVLEVQDI